MSATLPDLSPFGPPDSPLVVPAVIVSPTPFGWYIVCCHAATPSLPKYIINKRAFRHGSSFELVGIKDNCGNHAFIFKTDLPGDIPNLAVCRFIDTVKDDTDVKIRLPCCNSTGTRTKSPNPRTWKMPAYSCTEFI